MRHHPPAGVLDLAAHNDVHQRHAVQGGLLVVVQGGKVHGHAEHAADLLGTRLEQAGLAEVGGIGAGLAFAAAIKFYPVIFLLYFLLKRDLRVCISWIVAMILFYIIVPAAVMGAQTWLAFESAILGLLTGGGIIHDVNSQYFVHVAIRWFASVMDSADLVPVQVLRWIGYGETRLYLKRVALSYQIYRWLYDGD